LPDGSPPPPLHDWSDNDWTPYCNCLEFELANFLYMCNQMPEKQIDTLLNIWAASLMKSGLDSLFVDHKDLYKTIDSTPLGDVKWECFSIKYTGIQPEPMENSLPWMNNIYNVWFCTPLNIIQNIVANPDFATEMDFRTYREFETATDVRCWHDFMSRDWAWEQTVSISQICLVSSIR
ncbi:hypothetical protein PAXRUDRAFT_169715, partial [Paxillus rubicundulus Ve08.2h10]